MAKEGKNNFELKKGKRFQFDLSKNPKRTFDLVKDVAETPTVEEPVLAQVETKPIVTLPSGKPIASETKAQKDYVASASNKEKSQPKPQPTPQSQSKAGANKNVGKVDKQGSKQPEAPVVIESIEQTENEGGGSNKWMWIVGVILVVAIIAWLCVRGCSSSDDNGVATEPTVETVEATEVSEASEEEAVFEEPSTEGEAEQPVTSGAETESPATAAEETTSPGSSDATPTPAETASSVAAATPVAAPTSGATPAASSSRPSANGASTSASAPSAAVSSDIEAEAMKVIRGEYGTGLERKLKLGSKYREIQNRVNELKRQGAF